MNIKPLICLRCDHHWFPRGPVVTMCPKCKTHYWNTPKPARKNIMVRCVICGKSHRLRSAYKATPDHAVCSGCETVAKS